MQQVQIDRVDAAGDEGSRRRTCASRARAACADRPADHEHLDAPPGDAPGRPASERPSPYMSAVSISVRPRSMPWRNAGDLLGRASRVVGDVPSALPRALDASVRLTGTPCVPHGGTAPVACGVQRVPRGPDAVRLSFPPHRAPAPGRRLHSATEGPRAVRLNSIKLSGFKSFAEPTNFMLPGQLVGVVGPNGCGKSNIMDAVRWVLGESRASELRGESMQDVIFNGTTSRKPASRSSVELVFDNADHRAGGQWAQFAEIAVKRVLTRDGTSSYYINNQPVRRRDVQDVFLGTGLGPRAYAIIGQGTISRIIESKPEELRLFLEEAAGVSKYKERRRETENRPARHAREPDARRGHPARAQRQPRQAGEAGRGGAEVQRAAGRRHAQAAAAVVPEARRERGRPGQGQGRRREGRQRPRSRAWPTCAASKATSRPSARRTTRPATRSTRPRASSTKPAPRSAGWKPRSASWSKAASASSSGWCS